MPIYPLEIPAGVGFVKAKWQLNRSVMVSESPFTGKQQTYEYQYALWHATLTLPKMNRLLAGRWIAFISKLRGRRGTFLLANPDYRLQGNATGDMHTYSQNKIGDTSITLQTGHFGIENTFRAGDFIQIGSAGLAKMYMIVDDASTDAQGFVSINIEPGLKAAIHNQLSINYETPRGVFRMNANNLAWDTDKNRNYSITFSCTEVVI